MATAELPPTLQPLQECVRSWASEHERFGADLGESLAALEAFQRQLEDWQSTLAAEREELAAERQGIAERGDQLANQQQALDDERAAWRAENASGEQLLAEFEALRSEAASLREQRDAAQAEAERAADQQASAEAALEEAGRREADLSAAMEKQSAEFAEQQSRWDEDFRRMRDVLARQADSAPSISKSGPPPALRLTPAPRQSTPVEPIAEDPVLDSVLAQFGKLRQQQAGRRAPPQVSGE